MSGTNKIGDIGELAVAYRLIELGCLISFPFGHDQSYDMIADFGGKLLRVQVKNSTPKNGVLTCRVNRLTNITKGKEVAQTYTSKDVDMFLVRNAISGEIYNIPLPLLDEAKRTIALRYDSTKNNQTKNVRWADDYMLKKEDFIAP